MSMMILRVGIILFISLTKTIPMTLLWWNIDWHRMPWRKCWTFWNIWCHWFPAQK